MSKFIVPDARIEAICNKIKRDVDCENDIIKQAQSTIQDALDEIESIQALCPHAVLQHHPRATAEDEVWDTCIYCGATV